MMIIAPPMEAVVGGIDKGTITTNSVTLITIAIHMEISKVITFHQTEQEEVGEGNITEQEDELIEVAYNFYTIFKAVANPDKTLWKTIPFWGVSPL